MTSGPSTSTAGSSGRFRRALGKAWAYMARPLGPGLPRLALPGVLNIAVFVPGIALHPYPDYTAWQNVVYCLNACVVSFTLAWLLMLVVNIFRGKWAAAVFWLFAALMGLNALADAVCFGFLDRPYDHSFVYILAGSDMSESGEFIENYFRWDAVAYLMYAAAVAMADVTAADINTYESFKRMMSTFRSESDSRGWWEAPNLIEVARLNGYRTVWLSNHTKAGFSDNVVTRFARYADEARFTDEDVFRKKEGIHPLDEEILPIVEYALHKDDRSTPTVYFIHLFGNHFCYRSRYPRSFSIFGPEDYPHLPEHQRKTVAEYDNSVAYNDFIVDSIISAFSGREAVVMYLPDHGQDLYRTNSHQAGHARTDAASDAVGREIGLWIYMSPEYRRRFPEMAARISAASSRHLDATDFIYTFMDIIGTRFVEPQYAAPERSMLYTGE